MSWYLDSKARLAYSETDKDSQTMAQTRMFLGEKRQGLRELNLH